MTTKPLWLVRVGVALAATVAVGAASAPASAASSGAAWVDGSGVVTFTAGAGKANTVVLTRSGRTVTIDDTHRIKPGRGCKAVKGDRTRVRCTTRRTHTWLKVTLGNGHDSVVNRTGWALRAFGGSGNDRLTGGSFDDTLHGGSGRDRLYGLGGADHLDGAGGKDLLWGGDGQDRLYGGAGDDVLSGQADRDLLIGGDGNDRQYGGAGDDRLGGENEFRAGANTHGADVLSGGPGVDAVFYFTHNGVRVDLDGQVGDDGRAGEHDTVGSDVENISGSRGNDVLTGNARDNVVWGDKGDDVVRGGAGDDILGGDSGADRLYGEAGDDEIFTAEWETKQIDTVDGGDNTTALGDLCEADPIDVVANCERSAR